MRPALDIDKLIADVGKMVPGKPLDKYIKKAVFPNFKNLEPNTTIEFDYAITALVGANGSGKTSILHALYGMPLRKSTSRFWFSTAIDPIEDGGEFGVPSYFYLHWVSGLKRFVETRKVRGKKRYGYWEPARVLESDGMQPMPPLSAKDALFRSKDRWNPTEREVVYLNFKCEFSAFDRFFYFPTRGETQEERQQRFVMGAQRLDRVFKKHLKNYAPGGRAAVFENRDLKAEELKWVGYILGREYTAARYIQHRLYGGVEAPSVIFRRSTSTYSEAFAGSGELAMVRAVNEILKAPKHALVLLDEPETSLHPGAQERFLGFLLEMVRTKHIQVVMSTHSPTIVACLPPQAIRILEEAPSGRNRVVVATHPQVAFNRLGHTPPQKITIAIEDTLLEALVKFAMHRLDVGEREVIQLYIPPGGSSGILMHEIPSWIKEGRDIYVILDGDQKPKDEFPDPTNMSPAAINTLFSELTKYWRVNPMHTPASDPKTVSQYLTWVRNRVRFLTAECPEMVLLEALIGSDQAHLRAKNNLEAKTALIEEFKLGNHATDAKALANSVSFILQNDSNNKYIQGLLANLREFLKDHAEFKKSRSPHV